ncbi:hypothetical protein [Hyphobacterium sp.]|uniref:hypothetical protein n=1 Tax=Hyphobacterium sp. TaxID=2004662 RepID=UPI003BA9CC29
MNEAQFEAGVFGCKGVLYYHWSLADCTSQLNPFIHDFRKLSPIGALPIEQSELSRMKIWVVMEAVNRYRMLKQILIEYDATFATFVETRDPTRFRDFLIKAPAIFQRIGQHISSINHVCTYWKFHTKGEPFSLSGTEAYDVLRNFKTSLTYRSENETGEALAV